MDKKQVDWLIHYVVRDDEVGFCVNAHTHGLFSRRNHPELMITLPLPENVCANLLNTIASRICNGERFDEEGIRTDVLANNMKVRLIRSVVKTTPTIVLILPDENNNLPGDNGCKETYNEQIEHFENYKKDYEEEKKS